MWERRLSSLLAGMRIKFDQESPSVSVTEYLNHLYRVVSSLKTGLLGPDATTTIRPGEFKEFSTRVLRYVLVIPSGYSDAHSNDNDTEKPRTCTIRLVGFVHRSPNIIHTLEESRFF